MRRLFLVLGVLTAALCAAAPAGAASTSTQIYRDCEDDGRLQGSYSPADIREARRDMPSDLAEYTDCPDVLRRAELAGDLDGPGTPPPSTGGGGAVPADSGGAPAVDDLVPQTDADNQALADASKAPERPVTVAGENVLAGVAPLRDGYEANAIPGPLVVVLVLMALAGLALCLPPLRRHGLPRLRRR